MLDNTTRYPPGPTEPWLIGSYYSFKKDPLVFLRRQIEQFGTAVRFNVGPRKYYYFQRPEDVRSVLLAGAGSFPRADAAKQISECLGQGLVTTDGEQWRDQRRAVQPPFSERQVGEFFASIEAVVVPIVRSWSSRKVGATPFNMTEAAFEIAMAVAAKCFLSIGVERDTGRLRKAIETMGEFTMNRIATALRLPLWTPMPSHLSFRRERAIVDEIIYRVISQHRVNRVDNTVISQMLQVKVGQSQRTLTDKELRDQLVTLFLAGFDTTAASLAITMFLLATHPPVLAGVVDELHENVKGECPTPEELGKLVCLKNALLESLRLYPTVPLFSRVATADQDVGGYTVPQGTEVWISPYLTHRHADSWPNAEAFCPDRWRSTSTHPLRLENYLPFGKGPHTCIGAGFAVMEIQIVVAVILKRYTVRPETLSIHPVAKIAMGTKDDILIRLVEAPALK
jgi:cytochrome P450